MVRFILVIRRWLAGSSFWFLGALKSDVWPFLVSWVSNVYSSFLSRWS
jgi:hypothetical protein